MAWVLRVLKVVSSDCFGARLDANDAFAESSALFGDNDSARIIIASISRSRSADLKSSLIRV